MGWRSMIGNSAFETGITSVDMESRRMTSVAIVLLLNILIGWQLFYNLFKKQFFTRGVSAVSKVSDC